MPEYDDTSAESVLAYAERLFEKTLAEAVDLPPEVDNKRNRGGLGSLVEKYFFQLSSSEGAKGRQPDFPKIGLELKTTGLIKRADGRFRAKERLVLTMIDFMGIANEDWENCTLMIKCRRMLLLFYLYEKDVAAQDLRFVIPPRDFQFPPEDLVQIEQDWHFIRNKVLDGKAHELSEGDTFYLGACRKGAGGPSEALRTQPYSETRAKARAFSLKPNYVNKIISTEDLLVATQNDGSFSPGITRGPRTVEAATVSRFTPYLGLTVDELAQKVGYTIPIPRPKNLQKVLAERVLAGASGKSRELELAGIEMKTVRLKSNDAPKEAMSFPAFDYLTMVSEEWEDSSFFMKIERKFFFVIFRIGEDESVRLERVAFWNMPYEDREDARQFWEKVKAQIAVDATKVSALRSRVSHVRTHGRDGNDKLPTPQGGMWARSSFWLNQSYLKEVFKAL